MLKSVHVLKVKYQPSGTGVPRSPPHPLTARLIQNGRQGLEIGKTLGYWTLPSTFAKQVFLN